MFSSIELTIHLRVKTKEKGERVLGWFKKAFKREVTIVNFERNHDDPDLFRVDMTTALGVNTIQEAIFESLRICEPIAMWWTVNGPTEYEGGRWEFIGLAEGAQINIVGVHAAGFTIRNWDGWHDL